MTEAESEAYKKAVADKAAEAIDKITSVIKSEDKDNISKYKEDALKEINTKENEAVEKDLSNTRDKAVAAIEKKAGEAGKEIDALTELTEDEKQTAKTEINNVTQNTKTEIKKSEKSEIEGLQNSDISKVDEILENAKKQDLSKVKDVAKADITKKADAAKNIVDAMSKLTEDEKKAAKDEITEAAVKAEAAIDSAAAKEQVTEEKTAGCNEIQTITDKYAKQNFSKLKEDAIAVIETNANKATVQIDALEDLTAEQKTAAKNEINEKVTSTKNAIEEASTENEVESAKSTNIREVNQIVEDALNNAKETAKAAIDEKTSTAKATIDAMEYLTTEQKKAAKEEIDKLGATAKTTIEEVKNVSDNNKIKEAKKTSYTKVEQVVNDALAKDFSNAKVAAKAAIDETAKTAEEAIDAMPNLTDERKAAAKAQIATEAKAAKSAIDSVTDVTKKEEVTADKNAGIEALEKIVKEAAQDDLPNLKAAVKVQIRENAETAKKSVDALEDLTEAEKTEAKAKIEKSVEKATSAIDNVTDASKKNEVETAKNTNFDEVNQIVEDTSKKDLSNAKDTAKAEIDKKADEAKAAIDAMTDLTAEEKEAAKAQVDKEAEAAKKAIDSITDPVKKSDITGELEAGIVEISKKNDAAANQNESNAVANKEKAEEAEKKANTVIGDIKISATDKETIKNEIKKELEKEGLTGVDVDINDFNKVPATLDEDGRITGTVVIEAGSTKKTITIDKELPKLSSFVSYECQIAEDAPKASAVVDEKTLKRKVLSQEQIAVLANGGTSDIKLHIESKEKTVSDEDKKIVENALSDTGKVGAFIDISLLLTVIDAKKIHEPDTVFTITVTIPEKIRAEGRTYQIVRVHDGEAEILVSEYDGKEQTLTFDTDRFSTYAIIYNEINTNNYRSDDNNNADNTNSSVVTTQTNDEDVMVNGETGNSQTVSAPGTGDSNIVVYGLILLLIALVEIAGVIGKRRKENM